MFPYKRYVNYLLCPFYIIKALKILLYLKFLLCPDNAKFYFYLIIIRKQGLIYNLTTNYFNKNHF